MEDQARRALAAAVASGQAYHPDIPVVRETLRELREVFRRSAGTTAAVNESVLTDHLMARLAGINSYAEFLETPLRLDPDSLVPAEERARWMALPDHIWIDERSYPLDYVLGDDGTAVVRARIPAKTLNQVDEAELPTFDRPLHWTVTRGKHEAIRAATLDEARVLVRDTSSVTRNRARDAEEGGGTRRPPPRRRRTRPAQRPAQGRRPPRRRPRRRRRRFARRAWRRRRRPAEGRGRQGAAAGAVGALTPARSSPALSRKLRGRGDKLRCGSELPAPRPVTS